MCNSIGTKLAHKRQEVWGGGGGEGEGRRKSGKRGGTRGSPAAKVAKPDAPASMSYHEEIWRARNQRREGRSLVTSENRILASVYLMYCDNHHLRSPTLGGGGKE